MSYLGYTSIVSKYAAIIKKPTILEIGVDRGQTALPLIHNLTTYDSSFKWIGVDVRIDNCLVEQLQQCNSVNLLLSGHFDMNSDSWNVAYLEINSLKALPLFVKGGLEFDIILLDGDHNYATVTQELACIDKLTHDKSIILVDDYNGRWSGKDLFYKDRKTHSDNKLLKEQNIETHEKQGVKQAVDDWMSMNNEWRIEDLGFDCVVLHKDNIEFDIFDYELLSNAKLRLKSTKSNERFKNDYSEILNQETAIVLQ